MASSMTSSTYLSSTVYPQRPTPMYPPCIPCRKGRAPLRKNTRVIILLLLGSLQVQAPGLSLLLQGETLAVSTQPFRSHRLSHLLL